MSNSSLSLSTGGNFYISPKEADEGLDVRRTQVGSGPWQLVEYLPGIHIVYKRHEEYWDKSKAFVDRLEFPIIPEYAARRSQFVAGNVYGEVPGLTPEDVLQTKKDQDKLELYASELTGTSFSVFYGWNPAYGKGTPFRDRRLRQAFSMSWDRDLFIDVTYNIEKYRNEGVDMESRWHTSVPMTSEGYWLNPKDSKFGPNAKYFKRDIAEAKKLVAAAGYPDGLDIDAPSITTGEYGADFNKHVDILIGFASEVGLRMKLKPVGFSTDWRPKYSDSAGDFEGVSFRTIAEPSHDVIERLFAGYHPTGGPSSTGAFQTETSSWKQGDPRLNALMEKSRTEFDDKKRIEIAHEFQRIEAEEVYRPRFPGGATSFDVSWPAWRNNLVFRGDTPFLTRWIDPTRAPLA